MQSPLGNQKPYQAGDQLAHPLSKHTWQVPRKVLAGAMVVCTFVHEAIWSRLHFTLSRGYRKHPFCSLIKVLFVCLANLQTLVAK